jgi:hypothetical protein
MDFAASGAADFVPGPAGEVLTFIDAIARDPVATIQTTVRVASACVVSAVSQRLN